MKFKITLFREVVQLDTFETTVEAPSAAHAQARADKMWPENGNPKIKEHTSTDVGPWKVGSVEVIS